MGQKDQPVLRFHCRLDSFGILLLPRNFFRLRLVDSNYGEREPIDAYFLVNRVGISKQFFCGSRSQHADLVKAVNIQRGDIPALGQSVISTGAELLISQVDRGISLIIVADKSLYSI